MSDGLIFVLAFAVLLVGRVAVATFVFVLLLPRGDHCPMCDAATLRIQHRGWNTLCPWFRTSWCPGCGWNGLLRHGSVTPLPTRAPAPRAGSSRPS